MPKQVELLVLCDESGVSLQQIPKEVRAAFIPSPGHSFVAIDYSQMEYRVFASLSQDPKLIAAINSGQDFHTSVAAMMFDVPLDKVTKQQRDQGKVVNLGLLYGMTDFGLAQQLGITEEAAHKIKQKYETKFPVAQAWIQNQKVNIVKNRHAETYFGRIRPLGTKGQPLSSADIRQGFNTIIQGTAADILKVAMIKTSRHLDSSKVGRPLVSLHDEILFEVKSDKAGTVSKELAKIMSSLSPAPTWAKFGVDVSIGSNWAEVS